MRFLTTPEPDETVYSWCGFQHQASGSRSAAESARFLTGYSHATRQIDLPPFLASLPFIDRSSATEIEMVLRAHTVGGYYWPFQSSLGKHEILSEIMAQHDRHWRHRLCAQSRTMPFRHPLRWCPECALQDEARCGRAYWHVHHQLPLSYFCTKHSRVLNVASARPKTWISVAGANVDSIRHLSAFSETGVLAARLEVAIAGLEEIQIHALRKASIRQLSELGVILSVKSTQHRRITGWFKANPVAKWCMQAPFGNGTLAAGEWIASLLWRRCASNPVLWTLLWLALYVSEPERGVLAFIDAARGVVPLASGQLPLFPESDVRFPAPAHVRDAFMSATSYAEVMNALGVSRGDIVRWLETDQSLREEWRAFLRQGRRAQCEYALRAAIRVRPDAGRSYLVEKCGVELRWLQEHAPRSYQALLRSLPQKGALQRNIFDLLRRG